MSALEIVMSAQLTAIEYESGFKIYNTWEQIHVVLYVLVPFAIMLISNGLIIKSVVQTSANRSKSNLWGRMSITLLTVIVNLVFLANEISPSRFISPIIALFCSLSTRLGFLIMLLYFLPVLLLIDGLGKSNVAFE
jgi:hypothetical protein